MDFNPRAPCGARHNGRYNGICTTAFQSTRPMRGATGELKGGRGDRGISIHAPHAGRDRDELFQGEAPRVFQSTRPMRGATPQCLRPRRLGRRISIHAPHAGRDRRDRSTTPRRRNFNPRAPCGARLKLAETEARSKSFQSTRPMRGATSLAKFSVNLETFQSTRPMRGATRRPFFRRRPCSISIHAPHAGRDLYRPRPFPRDNISIHAPHAGRDGRFRR